MNTCEKKTCSTCAKFQPDYNGPACSDPLATRIEPIYGSTYQASCFLMRADGQPCGPEGKLHV